MKTIFARTAVLGLLLTTSIAFAQPPGGGPGRAGGPGRGGPPPEPSLMTYELAATAMAAAEAHARDNGWPMTIRIADQNDNVVMVHRMNNASPFTATIAARKTLTVIGSKMTSAEYGAKVAAGEIEALEDENAVTFGGGVPVYLDGELIGAIAASGARPDEDEEVSVAGVEAIGGSISN
jgi:glc operon protein GlcG